MFRLTIEYNRLFLHLTTLVQGLQVYRYRVFDPQMSFDLSSSRGPHKHVMDLFGLKAGHGI